MILHFKFNFDTYCTEVTEWIKFWFMLDHCNCFYIRFIAVNYS